MNVMYDRGATSRLLPHARAVCNTLHLPMIRFFRVSKAFLYLKTCHLVSLLLGRTWHIVPSAMFYIEQNQSFDG